MRYYQCAPAHKSAHVVRGANIYARRPGRQWTRTWTHRSQPLLPNRAQRKAHLWLWTSSHQTHCFALPEIVSVLNHPSAMRNAPGKQNARLVHDFFFKPLTLSPENMKPTFLNIMYVLREYCKFYWIISNQDNIIFWYYVWKSACVPIEGGGLL